MQSVTDSGKNRTEAAPKEVLNNLLRRMGETRVPANRIYEAMRMQLEELRRGFEKNGGAYLNDTEQKEFDERINSILKLSEIYQKIQKGKGDNISAEEMKQAETVNDIKEAIQGQKFYVREHSVEKEIEKVKDQTRGYVDVMRKSMEAYMISQRELGNLAGGVGALDAPSVEKARIGLAAVGLYEKLADPENGQKFYESFLSGGKDYSKTVQTIASSKEFTEATKNLMSASALKEFTANPKAGEKLWNAFEKELQMNKGKAPAAKVNEAPKKEAVKTIPKM